MATLIIKRLRYSFRPISTLANGLKARSLLAFVLTLVTLITAAAVTFIILRGNPIADGTNRTSPGGSVSDRASLLDSLRAEGASVELGETVSQPFFASQGQIIRTNGAEFQVFEFASEVEAKAAAESVSADGVVVGVTMLSWIDAPHFYQAGKLIVLYVGSDNEVTRLLAALLGPQFAGR